MCLLSRSVGFVRNSALRMPASPHVYSNNRLLYPFVMIITNLDIKGRVLEFVSLHSLLFHVPNLIRFSHCIEGSVRFRGLCVWFVTCSSFYGEELLAPRSTPKLEDHPLSAVRDCLFDVFASTLYIWRPFLHPQPEDAPCSGARDFWEVGWGGTDWINLAQDTDRLR
jgi:hypothetical protein